MENEGTAKKRILEIVARQPDDVSFDDILRELAFVRMLERGLADADAGRVTPHADVIAESRKWPR
jgi:predicted transcriptional regulator